MTTQTSTYTGKTQTAKQAELIAKMKEAGATFAAYGAVLNGDSVMMAHYRDKVTTPDFHGNSVRQVPSNLLDLYDEVIAELYPREITQRQIADEFAKFGIQDDDGLFEEEINGLAETAAYKIGTVLFRCLTREYDEERNATYSVS